MPPERVLALLGADLFLMVEQPGVQSLRPGAHRGDALDFGDRKAAGKPADGLLFAVLPGPPASGLLGQDLVLGGDADLETPDSDEPENESRDIAPEIDLFRHRRDPHPAQPRLAAGAWSGKRESPSPKAGQESSAAAQNPVK
ncbi:MAG: hypothetical protein WHT06_12320 [Desulfobacterales bacterium]